MEEYDDDPREKRGNKLAAERASRAYLRQHVGWLAGYPVGREGEALRWRTWPAAGGPSVDVVVDRERLRAAAFGVSGALRKFPRALPRLVGDVGAWQGALEGRLGLLKRVVHDGAPEPDAAAVGAAARVRLLDVPEWCAVALAWLAPGIDGTLALDAARVTPTLQTWRRALERVRAAVGDQAAVDVAATLALGASDATTRRALAGAAAVRGLLEDPRAFEVPTAGEGPGPALAARLGAAARDGAARAALLASPTPRPPAAVGPDLVAWLLRRPAAAVARLVDASLADIPLAAWDACWRRAEDLEREARSELHGLASRRASAREVAGRAEALAREAAAAIGEAPSDWAVAGAVRAAEGLAATCPPEALEPVVDAICEVPHVEGDGAVLRDMSSARAVVAQLWGEALASGLSGKRARALASLQGRARAAGGDDDAEAAFLTRAFAELVVGECRWPETYPWEHREVALATVLELARGGPEGRQVLAAARHWRIHRRFTELVLAAAKAVGPRLAAARAAELLVGSRDVMAWLDADLLVRIAPERSDEPAFWKHVAGLGDVSCRDVAPVVEAARDPAVCGLLRTLVEVGATATVNELVQTTAALRKLGADATLNVADLESTQRRVALEDDESRDDLAWVPVELRPAARDVRTLVGDRALDRALGDDVVRPARLTREAAALAARSTRTPHQEARLRALEGRLAAPPPLRSTQLAAVAERLTRRAARARAGHAQAALHARLADALPHALRPLLADAPDRELVLALAAQPAKVRHLGFRVLAGEDLAQEPEHVAWRARMRGLGLILEPWLAPDVAASLTSPSGRALTLAFERRPREVLRMGAWFDTCLAPSGMNFFSAVANAADENKRLIVLRDASGVVQARCLMALTTEGRLLTFHVYAHEEAEFAQGAVLDAAQGLARRLGTRLAERGQVPTLVAPRWYDDGPVDLAGHMPELDETGALTVALRASPPEGARALAVQHLGAERLEAQFERVVTHPIVLEEPRRVASLLHASHEHTLSLASALRVAAAVEPIARELARELLVSALERCRRGRFGLMRNDRAHCAELLVRLGEARHALPLVRPAGHFGARCTHALADALLALGRRNEAREVLTLLARDGDEAARQRVAAL